MLYVLFNYCMAKTYENGEWKEARGISERKFHRVSTATVQDAKLVVIRQTVM
jgi:hypothetical protein